MVSTCYTPAYRLSMTAPHSQKMCTCSGQELLKVMEIYGESYLLHDLPIIKLGGSFQGICTHGSGSWVRGYFQKREQLSLFKILPNHSTSLEL